MHPSRFRSLPRHCFLNSHWVSPNPVTDNGHSAIGYLTVPFMLGVTYIRSDFSVHGLFTLLLIFSGFLLGFPFNPEDGDNLFLSDFRLSLNYVAFQYRRLYSSFMFILYVLLFL
jgi:hypothetical protein